MHRSGRFIEATALYRRLLALEPHHAEALHMLGLIDLQEGRLEDAVAMIRTALDSEPSRASAHADLGVLLQMLHRHEEALASCEHAIALDTGNAGAHGNHGTALQALQRYDEALASHQRAVQLQPGRAIGHYNLGNTLQHLELHQEAIASLDRALALQPDYPEALNNRATSLRALGRNAEALASCDAALRLRPEFTDALYNRACLLRDMQRIEDALAGFMQLLAISPGHAYAEGIRLHLQLQCCDWTDYHARVQHISSAVAEGRRVDLPFSFLAISDSPAAQLQCARTFVADRHPPAQAPLWQPRKNRHARIRLAYVSADFHDHPMAHLMAGLFEAHDRNRFEIIGISHGPDSRGETRKRLSDAFDRFIDVRELDDLAIARLVRDLGVDIAVDRKGFTTGARTGIFALRPAPIQVNYLAYPGSMGASYIDYILADSHVIPHEQHRHYSECVVTLPDSYQANDDKRVISTATPTRSTCGLPEQGFVFCCFNNSHKISPDVFDSWMRLLAKVDGSVLWLFESSAVAARNLRREAALRGIEPMRLHFAPPLPQAEHLARLKCADLFLDTLPYNAHTTASDALWAGVPVLTRIGSTFAGRVAASLLHAISLPELVTTSVEDYETLALALATDPGKLATLKAKLARNRNTASLFDTRRFCRHLEAAFDTMWHRHVGGQPPASFSVERIHMNSDH